MDELADVWVVRIDAHAVGDGTHRYLAKVVCCVCQAETYVHATEPDRPPTLVDIKNGTESHKHS